MQKIDKYTGYMNQILTDVNRHDSPPTFIKDYIANYKEDLVIDNYKDEYSIKTNYDYSFSNGDLIINQIETNGTIEFEKSNKRVRDVIIYESENSQDLMRAGNVINEKYIINVKSLLDDLAISFKFVFIISHIILIMNMMQCCENWKICIGLFLILV